MVSWITRTTWLQLERLQREHAAVQSESFYLGVSLRGSIRSLNDKLLQYSFGRDPELRSAFLRESEDLTVWIETNRVQLARLANLELLKGVDVSHHLDLLTEAQAAYRDYLTNAAPLIPEPPRPATNAAPAALEPPGEPAAAPSFEAVYTMVRQASSELVSLSNELVDSQRQGFREFLVGTQDTLADHQRLLKITSVILLGLAAALAVLVYRGMIAPLRFGLSQSQSIIQRQEKLASLGILASGVAHEIRNPLTAIKFRLFSLKKTLPATAQSEDARMIGEEITRLERIVRDFLQFARPSEPELARVPARRVLEETQGLMGPHLERMAIQLLIEQAEPAAVHADLQQLKQVMVNLVRNAAESIGRNGRITLGLRRDTEKLQGRNRPAVILAVADTGKGIPPEIELRLFDPFFTTKERGTGLGLAISSRIVENHGGLLRYETEVNRGTTFEVVLPEVEPDATLHTPH